MNLESGLGRSRYLDIGVLTNDNLEESTSQCTASSQTS